MVGTIALLSDWFLRFTFWGGGRGGAGGDAIDGAGGAALVLFAIALVLSLVSPLIARLVQLAASRSTEALADCRRWS